MQPFFGSPNFFFIHIKWMTVGPPEGGGISSARLGRYFGLHPLFQNSRAVKCCQAITRAPARK